MVISNTLMWALNDFDQSNHSNRRATLILMGQLLLNERKVNHKDPFKRPVPVTIKVDKETGAIL